MEEFFKLKQVVSDTQQQQRYAERELSDYIRDNAKRLFEGTFWKIEYTHETQYYFCNHIVENAPGFGDTLCFRIDSFSISHFKRPKEINQKFSKNYITSNLHMFKTQITREEYETKFEVFRNTLNEFCHLRTEILIEKFHE